MSDIKLLRLPEVRAKVGISRSEIYRLVSLKRFPTPVPLGERLIAWRSDEINTWIAERIALRDEQATA